MGSYSVEKCIFTGLQVENLSSDHDLIEYYVTIGKKKHFIRLLHDAIAWGANETFFKENKYLFNALLLNNKWFDQEMNVVTIETLKQLLEQREFPKTPKQKTENLFYSLYKLQKEEGERVKIFDILWKHRVWQALYFKSIAETMFYFKHLENQGLIKMFLSGGGDVDQVSSYEITYAGL